MLTMQWDMNNYAVFYNNLFTIGLLVCILIMPFYTSVFYGWNINKMDLPEFNRIFGTLYEGLNLDMEDSTKRLTGLFFPFFFVVRRLLFIVAAIFLENFLWGQLAIQFFCSVTMIIYLCTFWPFVEPIFTKIEIMNEVTSIFLLYHMFTFTDWVPDASVRYLLGWSFIAVISANLAFHLSILTRSSIAKIFTTCKAKCHKMTEDEKKAEAKHAKEEARRIAKEARDAYIMEGREPVEPRGPT